MVQVYSSHVVFRTLQRTAEGHIFMFFNYQRGFSPVHLISLLYLLTSVHEQYVKSLHSPVTYLFLYSGAQHQNCIFFYLCETLFKKQFKICEKLRFGIMINLRPVILCSWTKRKCKNMSTVTIGFKLNVVFFFILPVHFHEKRLTPYRCLLKSLCNF